MMHLEEFESEDVQREYWLSDGSSGKVSSFQEAFEGLFGDSNLIDAIEEGSVAYPSSTIQKIRNLYQLLSDMKTEGRKQIEIIQDPDMRMVRAMAANLRNELARILRYSDLGKSE